ncbi:MAG: copper amine oxidase N-terminal domain-containing protein [Syntrophomonadaceae bacterium]|nr:copper amine oxidase N-terminal domain-containing protein [Syntrophomonadaceae bacterium]
MASVNFDVNGAQIKPNAKFELVNGVTYIESNMVDAIIGADVKVNGENIIILHNDDQLVLNANQNNAVLNGQDFSLPSAPYIKDGAIMLPLRAVFEALGFEIGWDAATNTVIINYNEIRNGMTADDLMVKSSQITNEMPAYDMKGNMFIKMNMPGIEEEGFSEELVMDIKLYAYYQKEPLAVYTKQVLNVAGMPDVPPELANAEIESAIIDNIYYMNMPGMGWVKMDLGDLGIDELMDQLTNQDPVNMLKQMQDFGMINNYGNDTVIEGKNYYVVNTSVDKDKFMNEYNNLINGLPISQTPEITDLLGDFDLDVKYISFINMETLMADYMDMDMSIKMSIPASENSSEVIDMVMTANGRFKINYEPVDFVLPDVSSAVEMPLIE